MIPVSAGFFVLAKDVDKLLESVWKAEDYNWIKTQKPNNNKHNNRIIITRTTIKK